jgi:hypothetical protein
MYNCPAHAAGSVNLTFMQKISVLFNQYFKTVMSLDHIVLNSVKCTNFKHLFFEQ